MKAVLVVLALIFSLSAFADGHSETGVSYQNGVPGGSCTTVPAPSQAEAEAMADRLAQQDCAYAGKVAQRVTDFQLSLSECYWSGPRYRTPTVRLFATATYSCVGSGEAVHECRPFTYGCCGGRWCRAE